MTSSVYSAVQRDSTTFKVTVSLDNDVDDLKEGIREQGKHSVLSNVDAKDLVLCNPNAGHHTSALSPSRSPSFIATTTTHVPTTFFTMTNPLFIFVYDRDTSHFQCSFHRQFSCLFTLEHATETCLPCVPPSTAPLQNYPQFVLHMVVSPSPLRTRHVFPAHDNDIFLQSPFRSPHAPEYLQSTKMSLFPANECAFFFSHCGSQPLRTLVKPPTRRV